jgi:hypothetical protein
VCSLAGDGAPTSVRLPELFAPGKDTLVIYTPLRTLALRVYRHGKVLRRLIPRPKMGVYPDGGRRPQR